MQNKIIINIFFLVLFIAVLAYSGCDDTTNISDLDSKVIPSQNVSYSQHIQPVLTAKCAVSGCHDDQTRAGNLSLTSYSNTTADYLVVAPGLPQNSKLVWSVEGTGGKIMPPIGSNVRPLTQNQIDGIKTWIKEGAKNN
ncbi:MAG: c-type cytochrome domain-containing protein [Bacteroidota bacterium]